MHESPTRIPPHSIAVIFALLFSCLVQYRPAYAGDNDNLDKVPGWARDAVWYQIFPERFRNGDKGNDPTLADIAGSWPHEQPKEWHISSWTGDWYALQPWETNAFYYCAQQRRYGGDLEGVIDELGYLKDLGINAIYLNPIFESPSLHKYDATMYHHIDNNFGPDPDGDRAIWKQEDPSDPSTWQWTSADRLFLQLIQKAHALGIRVIIDGVFNHVGMTFWAFKDVQEKGENSKFRDWFVIKKWDDPATPENEFSYQGWNDVKELPELREDDAGLVAGPREHIHQIVKRWMDPNGDGVPTDGIDGWRLDVAEKVNIAFWRDFRRWVRSINPDAYTVGEVFWDDWRNGTMFNAAPWLKGDAFDAVMNYRWAREADHFFRDQKNKITASEFDSRLNALRNDYRPEVNYVLMNLMDSHDTDRLSSQIVNIDTQYDQKVGESDNPDYDVRKPTPGEVGIQKLIILFQMTYLGAPSVYYGDEAGMWGGDDPDERKPMLWADLKYDDESHHPREKTRPIDKNQFNEDLFSFYKAVIGIRRGHRALSRGDYRTVLADNGQDLYAFLRSYEGEHILVVLNNSQENRVVNLPSDGSLPEGTWKSIFAMNGSTFSAESSTISLAAKSGILLQGFAK